MMREGGVASRPDSANRDAARRAVRAAGVVMYLYAGLTLAAGIVLVAVASAAFREGTAPCPPDETTCESLGVVVGFLVVAMAVLACAVAALSALLAVFLRRESRVAVWFTLVLGGVVAACLTVTGLAALAGDQPGTAALGIGLAAVIALPVGLVARGTLARPSAAEGHAES